MSRNAGDVLTPEQRAALELYWATYCGLAHAMHQFERAAEALERMEGFPWARCVEAGFGGDYTSVVTACTRDADRASQCMQRMKLKALAPQGAMVGTNPSEDN